MNALTTSEAASGARERGLEFLRQELLEDRPRRIRAAALLAVKLGAFYEHKEAPAVLEALLKVAGAA